MQKYNPKLIILFSFGLFTIVHVLFLTSPGHLSIDEGIYHLMVRSFSDSGNLEIWNGYQEFPSRELALSNVGVHEGRLVPQYPYLFPVMAYPFYRVAGYHGLFILNAISFLGVLGLCFALGKKLFQDQDLALNACLILVLATYAWEYSQAAWPHATSMLFTTGAVYLSILAADEKAHCRSLQFACTAGLVTGFGAGVRLDVFFVFPVIVAPFLFVRPVRPWQVLATSIGTVPGLLVLAATNYIKFGVASPFSYGNIGGNVSAIGGNVSGIGPYLPLVTFALAGSAVYWIFTRLRSCSCPRSMKISIGLLTLALGISIFPSAWDFLSKLAFGAYQLVIDLRFRSLDIVEPGLSRTPSGALVYHQLGLKKSLLQSCPYLTCLAFPLRELLRKRKNYLSLCYLFFAAAILICPFSFFAWHGGLSINMRYFLPALPFTSIITAYTLKELTFNLNRNWRFILILIGFLTYSAYCVFLLTIQMTAKVQEIVYLTLPIVLAVLLLLLLVSYMKIGEGKSIFINRASIILLVITLVWSGLVSFSYDFSSSYAMRASYANISQKVSNEISSNSILFTDFPDPFFGLIEIDRIRIAVPTYDNFGEFRKLIDFYLDGGYPVYASFPSETWQSINSGGHLELLNSVTLLEHRFGTLVKIYKPPPNGHVKLNYQPKSGLKKNKLEIGEHCSSEFKFDVTHDTIKGKQQNYKHRTEVSPFETHYPNTLLQRSRNPCRHPFRPSARGAGLRCCRMADH